jgi:hypothetical protein
LVFLAASCSSSSDPSESTEGCANVIFAQVVKTGSSYRVTATVSSPDTGWEKYADRLVVRTPSGFVLQSRELEHPHLTEQPFTRTLTGVRIPEGEEVVEVAASDSVEGFCGKIVVLDVPGS